MTKPPFSLPVNVRKLPKKGQHIHYEAPAEVCAEIARSYDLVSVEKFHGHCVVAPWQRDGVKVTGTVSSLHTQPCAVTAKPLALAVKENINAIYVAEGSRLSQPKLDGEGEMIIDPFGDDIPDVFQGDSIDLAEVMLEFFALGLNPFERADDAKFDAAEYRDEDASPFAALQELKSTLKKQ